MHSHSDSPLTLASPVLRRQCLGVPQCDAILFRAEHYGWDGTLEKGACFRKHTIDFSRCHSDGQYDLYTLPSPPLPPLSPDPPALPPRPPLAPWNIFNRVAGLNERFRRSPWSVGGWDALGYAGFLIHVFDGCADHAQSSLRTRNVTKPGGYNQP